MGTLADADPMQRTGKARYAIEHVAAPHNLGAIEEHPGGGIGVCFAKAVHKRAEICIERLSFQCSPTSRVRRARLCFDSVCFLRL
jgi:hypothetical protein